MLSIFKNQLIKHLHIKNNTTFLCAVSGGMDSMVMLDMIQKIGYTSGVVHIDHDTRGGTSTEDAQFVAEYCKKNDIPFFHTKIEKDTFSNGNFQNEARVFRYEFFNTIAQLHNYDYILTAHHKDDRWETFVQHLAKSAGIDGLTSLRYKEGNIIRPLLPFTRKQIDTYAEDYGVPFVHDISNDSDDYTRNKVRHHITPAFEFLFDDFINNANRSIHYLEQENRLLLELIERSDFIKVGQNIHSIDLNLLESYTTKEALLFKLIKSYGFTHSDTTDILKAQTGALFYSGTHEALKDRSQLLIRQKQSISKTHLEITDFGTYALTDGRTLSISKAVNDQKLGLSITFPFTIRTWAAGDHFRPTGMNGKSKKVKDFLTDKKLSRWEKETTFVTEKDGILVQIIGHRSAETYEGNNVLITLIES